MRRLQAVVVDDHREDHVVDVRLVAGAEDERRFLAGLHEATHAGLVDVDAVVDAVEDEVEQDLDQVDDEGVVAGGDLAQVAPRFPLDAAVGAALLAGDLGERAPQLQIAQRLVDHARGRLERRAGDHAGLAREVLVNPSAHAPGDARRLRVAVHRVDVAEQHQLADLDVRAFARAQVAEEGADGAGLFGIAEEEIAPRAAQPLGALAPEEGQGHERDRLVRLRALQLDQRGEGIGQRRDRGRQRARLPEEDQRGLALLDGLDDVGDFAFVRALDLRPAQVPARERREDAVAEPRRGARERQAQLPKSVIEI